MSQWEGRGSRHSRGYGSQWDKLRKQILQRDKWLCQRCLGMQPSRVYSASHVDHIKTKADGGTDDPSNLQSLCATCHRVKTVLDAGGKPKVKHRIGLDGWPIGECS